MPRYHSLSLSKTEEMLLLAVLRLGENAYGAAVRRLVSEQLGKPVSVGAVYIPLDRLTGRSLLITFTGDPTPERGGRSKRYYRLTAMGMDALQESRDLNEAIWKDIPDLSDSASS